MRIPHGVGEVWAQGAWEVYWALVDEHGFDPDLYNAMGGSGNQRAMLYVNEGLKNTACSPTFTDVRDGMILAAQSLQSQLGGQDDCLMWEAFAAFGLGVDAVSGGSNSIDPTNGFAVPAACQNGQPTVTINASDATATEAGPTSGEFTVTRGGDPLPALTVSYTVGGGASSGSDYAALSGSVSLAATETTATISVDPIDDPDVESDETVIVTLSADATYNVGSPSQATVTIESDDTPTGGGSGSVKGSTRDEFGAKLAGVLVTVDTTPNPDPSASSNNGGKYNIASVAESAPGTPWLVIATKDDYCMDGSPEAVVNAGLTTTVDITMNVGECGPPPSGPTASFTYDCTALSCQFTDTSSEGDSTIDTWLWTFGDGNSSTEQNPLYVYASSGTRQVTLTVEDLEDDSDSTSQDVTVTDTSDPPPTVTGCSPASANQNDRLPVTVTGTYFQNGATVDFGTRVSVQGVSYIDDEQLVVQVKVHKRAVSGPRTVTVDNPVGPSATGIGCFSVE
jgi:PKD repeat protein